MDHIYHKIPSEFYENALHPMQEKKNDQIEI